MAIRSKRNGLGTIVCLLLPALAFAQESAPSEADKVAQAQVDAYISAFNQGDAKAVASLYAEDARFAADDGSVASGRAAVETGLATFFARNKGAKLAISISGARFLTPDVLVENGLANVAGETTRYSATYVKKDGKWLIAELIEAAVPDSDAAAQTLGELGWMIGSWSDASAGAKVETRVDWTKNGHFLRRSFTVTRDGDAPVEGTELIGYDPVAGQVRSWIFDSNGGFGEGLWRQDGNKWLVNARSTAPDGRVATAQHVITRVDDKKFTWESVNRQSGGEVLPNLDKVEVVRTGAE